MTLPSGSWAPCLTCTAGTNQSCVDESGTPFAGVHQARRYVPISEGPPTMWPGYHLCEVCGAGPSVPCVGLDGVPIGDAHVGRRYSAPGAPDTPAADGPVLAALRADLETIDVGKVPGGHTYRALALWLAGVIDKRGTDDGPSVTAKLADQLGRTMAALTRKGGEEDDGFQDFADSISEPIREQ